MGLILLPFRLLRALLFCEALGILSAYFAIFCFLFILDNPLHEGDYTRLILRCHEIFIECITLSIDASASILALFVQTLAPASSWATRAPSFAPAVPAILLALLGFVPYHLLRLISALEDKPPFPKNNTATARKPRPRFAFPRLKGYFRKPPS